MRPTSSAPARLVLASQSPRRRRLLTWLGLPFDCTVADTPEDLDSPLAHDPGALAETLAAEKVTAARDEDDLSAALVLGFDTIVVLDGTLLGKPLDEADAWRMLRSLSGRSHEVVTGCAVSLPGEPAPRTFHVITRVEMHDLTECRIAAWMATGTYLGCAGAYNIEAQIAGVATDECYQNVAGLPLCHLHAALAALPDGSFPGRIASPIAACDAALSRTCELGPRVVEPPD